MLKLIAVVILFFNYRKDFTLHYVAFKMRSAISARFESDSTTRRHLRHNQKEKCAFSWVVRA